MTGGRRLVAINAEHQGSGREQVAIDDQALGRWTPHHLYEASLKTLDFESIEMCDPTKDISPYVSLGRLRLVQKLLKKKTAGNKPPIDAIFCVLGEDSNYNDGCQDMVMRFYERNEILRATKSTGLSYCRKPSNLNKSFLAPGEFPSVGRLPSRS